MEKFFSASAKIFLWIFLGGILKLSVSKVKLPEVGKLLQIISETLALGIVPVIMGIKIWYYECNYQFIIYMSILFVILMFVSYVISKFLTTKFPFTLQEVYLPLTFMNTIYLGIPVTEYFISSNMVHYTIMYSAIVTILQFTVGIYIMTLSTKFISFIAKIPIIYAFLVGWLLNYHKIPVPQIVLTFHELVSKVMSPIMLIYMGYSIPWKSFLENIRIHIFTNILRIIIFFIISTFFCIILKQLVGIEKNIAKVLILVSILPSAIVNYILTEKFNVDTKFVCGEIFWGTGITIFLLPYLSELLEIIFLAIY